jgi:hypothetical protein
VNVKFDTRGRVLAVLALGLLVVAALTLALVRTTDSEKSEAAPSEKPTAVGSWERIAFDGTNYLVVWDDDRGGKGGDIFGARVSQDGTVLDRPPIQISTARESQVDPKVAFDGRNFLIVWSDDRVKPDPDHPQDDIFGARVTRTGVVLDRGGIPISTAESQQFDPSVAFDGSHFLVVWTDFGSGFGDIYGARISPAGKVLDANGFVIASGDKEQLDPAVAFDGTRYLVAWSEESDPAYDIFAARITRAGEPRGRAIRVSTGGNASSAPSIASGNENFLVAWTHWPDGEWQSVLGARVDRSGAVLDPEGLLIDGGESDRSEPSVAFDGTAYRVIWNAGDVYSARVGEDGALLDPVGKLISGAPGSQGAYGIGYDSANYLVTMWAWSDEEEPGDIYAARVDKDGEVIDRLGILISRRKKGS